MQQRIFMTKKKKEEKKGKKSKEGQACFLAKGRSFRKCENCLQRYERGVGVKEANE